MSGGKWITQVIAPECKQLHYMLTINYDMDRRGDDGFSIIVDITRHL